MSSSDAYAVQSVQMILRTRQGADEWVRLEEEIETLRARIRGLNAIVSTQPVVVERMNGATILRLETPEQKELWSVSQEFIEKFQRAKLFMLGCLEGQ